MKGAYLGSVSSAAESWARAGAAQMASASSSRTHFMEDGIAIDLI
jgi:hypothetical protein